MGKTDAAIEFIIAGAILIAGASILSERTDCCDCTMECARQYILSNEPNLSWGRVYESEGLNQTIEQAKEEGEKMQDAINSLKTCNINVAVQKGK